jgi:hypothetical protein
MCPSSLFCLLHFTGPYRRDPWEVLCSCRRPSHLLSSVQLVECYNVHCVLFFLLMHLREHDEQLLQAQHLLLQVKMVLFHFVISCYLPWKRFSYPYSAVFADTVVPSRSHRTIIRWVHDGIARASRSRVAFLKQSGSFLAPAAKSLACQKIAEGPCEGAFSCVHFALRKAIVRASCQIVSSSFLRVIIGAIGHLLAFYMSTLP